MDDTTHTHNGIDSPLVNKQANALPEVTRGIVAPANLPKQVGDIYCDTTAGKVYIATGLTLASWKILN